MEVYAGDLNDLFDQCEQIVMDDKENLPPVMIITGADIMRLHTYKLLRIATLEKMTD